MRINNEDDMVVDKRAANYAGAIVIGAILALAAIRIGFVQKVVK